MATSLYQLARICFTAAVGLLLAGCGSAPGAVQRPDLEFSPKVSPAAYPKDGGPLVLIDAAHYNFHTAVGRYSTFAKLLRDDGYRVAGNDLPFSAESLAEANVLVISNALHEGNQARWTLPTPSAFTDSEIEAVRSWVEAGGSLLLIADHMPFPGAAEKLGGAFGLLFHNGYARDPETGATVRYATGDGLERHPITEGKVASESVHHVVAFGGQAFRLRSDVAASAAPLLTLRDGSTLQLPHTASTFDQSTPTIPADGLLQGAALEVGRGRVAAFGEAAMFSAQVLERRDGSVLRMGMNGPEAEHNAQFALNVLHWLTGALD